MEKVRLLDVCDVYQPQTIATKQFVPDGKYIVYGANGAIGRYSDYNHEESEVLMACRGATCGAINVSQPYSWVNGNAMVVKPNGIRPINKKYLMYFLMSANKENIISGTAQPQITRQNMKDFQIVICEEREQERVVTRIEEMFSELDDGVETLKKIKEQLAVYRQAVLKEAFSRCSDRRDVASICEHVTDGDHMPPPKEASGIPFIMISNIDNNTINWSNTAYVGSNYYEKIDLKRKPQKGDVLYTVTGSYGIPIMVDFDKEFCFQRHIALLRPNSQIHQKYLYYAMMEPGVYAQATEVATGTAQKTVGLGVLKKIKIPFVSDLDIQDDIVECIESKMSVCDSIEKTIDDALQRAEALRQSILKEAFEGRL